MMKMLLVAGFAAGLALGQGATPVKAESAAQDEISDQLARFSDIFDRIRTTYVDEVSDAELIKAAIDGMLSSLDPHSSYLPPSDYEALRTQTRGAFGGVGIEVTDEAGRVTIVRTTEGAAADRAGVQAGDVITHLDGEAVEGLTLRETSARIRGTIGTQLQMTLRRKEQATPIELLVTRESIRVRAVRSDLENEVVILKITGFNEQTFPMLREGFAEQVAEAGGLAGVKGVIIDLRDNRGGLLDQAIKVSDAFLEEGRIVTTRGRDPSRSGDFRAEPGDLAHGRPIVVLINGRSASASEIVAGALQDNARALVVGTQSFGKGSVQTIMAVPRNGAMKLTTSRYYTPSGRSIQTLGISPDLIVEPRPEEEDYQLAYAVNIVRGLALIGPAPARAEAVEERRADDGGKRRRAF